MKFVVCNFVNWLRLLTLPGKTYFYTFCEQTDSFIFIRNYFTIPDVQQV